MKSLDISSLVLLFCICRTIDASKSVCQPGICGPDERCIRSSHSVDSVQCVCNSRCTREHRQSGPVCANNGLTFANLCKLRQYKCSKSVRNLNVAYFGKCIDSCENVNCLDGNRCVINSDGKSMCMPCDIQSCEQIKSFRFKLCTLTGQSFANTCELQREICRIGKAIQVHPAKQCRTGSAVLTSGSESSGIASSSEGPGSNRAKLSTTLNPNSITGTSIRFDVDNDWSTAANRFDQMRTFLDHFRKKAESERAVQLNAQRELFNKF